MIQIIEVTHNQDIEELIANSMTVLMIRAERDLMNPINLPLVKN